MRFMKVLGLAVAAVVTVGALSACEPVPTMTYTITKSSSGDPGYSLRYSWAAGVPVESAYPTVCAATVAPSGEDSWQCRSLHGYDELGGDHDKNYILSNFDKDDILSKGGTYDSKYGFTLVMQDGKIFEGCRANDYKFYCDYYSTKWSAPFPRNITSSQYVLHKTWDWFGYAGDAAGCAFGISAVMGGGALWKEAWLVDCVRGPM